MEETILRFRYNLYRESKRKARIAQIIVCVAGFCVIALMIWWMIATKGTDVVNNIIASFVGVAALFLMARLSVWILHRKEDQNKVSYRNQDMWSQYGTKYREIFTLNKSQFVVYCEPLFYAKQAKQVRVVDDPKDFFQLDPYIKFHCPTLLEAHAMSNKLDSVTVRLTDFDPPTDKNGNTATIYSGRSSYLAHLLTNRALDYFIEGDLTIRKLYENDKNLRPLRRAMLSNHFGVNALVFLTDDTHRDAYLLLPHRKNTATVAKNSLTASIATRLEMTNELFFEHGYEDHMTFDYIEKACVQDNISNSIWVKGEWAQNKTEIHFLGLSRDIYEGGKPTLFYVVYLAATPAEYKKAREDYKAKKTKKTEESEFRLPEPTHSIDEVETVHIAQWSTVNMQEVYDEKTHALIKPEEKIHDIRLDQALLTFVDEENITHSAAFEQNLISNFKFLIKYNENEKVKE